MRNSPAFVPRSLTILFLFVACLALGCGRGENLTIKQTDNENKITNPAPTEPRPVKRFKYAGDSLLLYGGEEEFYVDENRQMVITGKYCEQTVAAADSRIQEFLNGAQTIIEKNVATDGIKAEYVISSEKLKSGKVVVLSTDGTNCYQAEFAPSLELLSDFHDSFKVDNGP